MAVAIHSSFYSELNSIKKCSRQSLRILLQEVIVKSTRLWIAHSDEFYVNQFAQYANLKKNHLFQVRTCMERQQLQRGLKDKEMEILLLSVDWYEACKDLLRDECVILLSEGSVPAKLGSYPAVYKYQSVENILCEIMFFYAEGNHPEECYTGVHKDNRVIGVYSPDGNLSMVFALTLGQILAEHQNVLYLNLEGCSGFSELFGQGQWNLADLIYYLRQNKTSFLYRLNSMVRRMDRLQYVNPCETYTDFTQIGVEEWQQLLYLIRTQSSYDYVVLDFGNASGHEPDLLRQCDGIYLPMREDLISQARVNQWQSHIKILDGIDILEKLQTLDFTGQEIRIKKEEDFFLLPQGSLGQRIRRLLQE